jgi:hypothetical protein
VLQLSWSGWLHQENVAAVTMMQPQRQVQQRSELLDCGCWVTVTLAMSVQIVWLWSAWCTRVAVHVLWVRKPG